MYQPGWEEGFGENEYMYMHGWVPLLFTYFPIQNVFSVKKKKKERKKKDISTFPLKIIQKN